MGLLKAYNGLLGAVVTVFGAYHVLFPYHAIELYGVYDPVPPPPAPSQSGARLYVHDDTPATGSWFITMMGIMMILVGTCLMASRAWGSGVRAIVGSTTLALFLAILGVVLIEGPESGLPRFTTANPVHVALVVAIVLYIPPLIVNRMEPGVFEWDKAAHVAMTEEDSDGEDEKLIAAGVDSPIYGASDFSDDPGGAVARVLARQSDYYAVLGVRKDTAHVLSERKLRERYDALVNAMEKAPGGKDRETALGAARSAHATLANPLTRARYDGWRRYVFPARGDGARTPRGSHGHMPRWCASVLRTPIVGVLFAIVITILLLPVAAAMAAIFAAWWLLLAPIRACADLETRPGRKRRDSCV